MSSSTHSSTSLAYTKGGPPSNGQHHQIQNHPHPTLLNRILILKMVMAMLDQVDSNNLQLEWVEWFREEPILLVLFRRRGISSKSGNLKEPLLLVQVSCLPGLETSFWKHKTGIVSLEVSRGEGEEDVWIDKKGDLNSSSFNARGSILNRYLLDPALFSWGLTF